MVSWTPQEPTDADAEVPPPSFYSSSAQNPPPLPDRPTSAAAQNTQVGSAHTTYFLDSTDSTFREPELVRDDDPSTLNDPSPFGQYTTLDASGAYDTSSGWAGGTDPNIEVSDWQTPYTWPSQSTDPWQSTATWTAPHSISIDGRNMVEEEHWWDADVRAQYARPGPGVLPPLLVDLIHNPEHTLFSVSVTPPDIKKSRHARQTSAATATAPSVPVATPDPASSAAPAEDASNASAPDTATQAHSPTTKSDAPTAEAPEAPATLAPAPPAPPPPSQAEAREAVPHPNAYYCRKHNGWLLLHAKSSIIEPTLAPEYLANNPDAALPSFARRCHTESCIKQSTNETHHLHVYRRAVDARSLPTPFLRSPWERAVHAKQRRRAITISEDVDVATATMVPSPPDHTEFSRKITMADADAIGEHEGGEADGEGELLDLYVCCQCQFLVLASDVIPGVVPVRYIEDLVKEKTENPAPGKNGVVTAIIALETIINIIQNRLWTNEVRGLPVGRAAFQRKLGWNRTVQQIFDALGFHIRPAEENEVLDPPSIEGHSRRKLLRAWVELSAWTVDYMKRFPKDAYEYKSQSDHVYWVKIDSVREVYQHDIGAHPDQIPRSDTLSAICTHEVDEAIRQLGMTPTTYTWELLVFAYFAQARCDPAKTTLYFTALNTVVAALTPGSVPEQLQNIVIDEHERGRMTTPALAEAATTLGFGREGPLGLDLEDELEDEFIENAWRDVVRRAWRGEPGRTVHQANDALRAVAEARGSKVLRARWEQAKNNTMTPERAFNMFNVEDGSVDDTLLIAVYQLGVEDQPGQTDRLREALTVIAEYRDSARLRKFLEIGTDPGELVTATRHDWPRGLNQLGNTCYLNSLLQYFYTIKDLRHAIAPLMNSNLKSDDDDKLTDDVLKRHRVGGRLVTRREITRSKRFVNQLAELFFHMQCAENPAVTPTVELAKLALVTSKDEEEEADGVGAGAGTDSSNDTDATLVDDGPPRVVRVDSPVSATSSSSVLGKRSRTPEPMNIDHEEDASSPTKRPSPPADSPAQDKHVLESGAQAQVAKPTPPPLPARKVATDGGGMMFGRQHDVSECMDNCIFQIETALLKFDGMVDTEDGKASLVKRLFFGKLKQRIVAQSEETSSSSRMSVHEREDLFSLLPVNVSDESFDMYDGLASYFVDTVEFEKRKARMEVSLVDLPPILQIQLQRAQFNRETLQPYKSQAYVKFGETLYLDRFLDGASPEKKERSRSVQTELNECRDRIHQLTTGKHAPYGPALSNTLEFFSKQDGLNIDEIDDVLVGQLAQEQSVLSQELDELRTRASTLKQSIEDLWQNECSAEYELTSVFIHRGSSPSFGHYFFYSRHLPERPDEWFKYNDAEVSLVPKEEVLADTTGETANPYMLVYVRKGTDMIDTVYRLSAEDDAMDST